VVLTISIGSDVGDALGFTGAILTIIGLALFIIFLTIWLVTRTKKQHEKSPKTRTT
jgi:predicted MFS family arabinose efflux permease